MKVIKPTRKEWNKVKKFLEWHREDIENETADYDLLKPLLNMESKGLEWRVVMRYRR